MSKIKAKIGVRYQMYAALETLGQAVFLSMTGNLNFVTPSPTLISVQAATTALSAAITAWGSVGNRGTHQDLINLRSAALTLYKLLKLEAAYVSNLVDPNATELVQTAFILSSGFSVKAIPAPQGVLNPPQNLHVFSRANILLRSVGLRWKKPLGLTSPGNVKSYTILRGATNDPTLAGALGQSKTTIFIDSTAAKGTTYWYFVVANNDQGAGAVSVGLSVTTPA